MRVLICTVGSRGDVQPALVLGRALLERGHAVRMAAPPNFAPVVLGSNIEFQAIGSDTERMILENQRIAELNPVLALPRQIALLRRETEQQLHDLLEYAQPADLVIGAGLAFAAPSCAELLKARYVYLCYTIAGIRAAEHPPAAMPIFGLPRWGNRLLWSLLIQIFDKSLGKPINRARRAHRLTHDSRPWYTVHAQHTLLAQDALMGELPASARSRCHHVPALVAPAPAPRTLPGDVASFLAARRSASTAPLVYVGFGSMPTHDRERVVRAIIELRRATHATVLFFSPYDAGGGRAGFHELAEGVWSVPALDHSALFPRMDLVVHHGGAGTTATALRSGVPQFIVPHIVDQYFHGRRIAELGLGPKPVPKARLDGAALIAALAHSHSCVARARDVGAQLARVSGADEAARYLERVAAGDGLQT